MTRAPDIVWYRAIDTIGCYAVLPEHPGDPRGETCYAFEPVSPEVQREADAPPWVMITTTIPKMLHVSRVAWHHEAEPVRLWLLRQGYTVEPRRFSLAEVDAERVRRAKESFYPALRP